MSGDLIRHDNSEKPPMRLRSTVVIIVGVIKIAGPF